MDEYFKNANIAFAAGAPILVIGVIVFGTKDEGVLFLLLLATFVTMATVKTKLDNRTMKRRRDRRDQ